MTKTEAGPSTDPFEVWREMYDANERAWTTALEEAMGSTEFRESSGKLLETMLAAQKSVRNNMRTYLETMNVPTREDIARLGELVIGLEEKIDQLTDRFDAIEDVVRTPGPAGPAGPVRSHGPNWRHRPNRRQGTCRTERTDRVPEDPSAPPEKPAPAGPRRSPSRRPHEACRSRLPPNRPSDDGHVMVDAAGRRDGLVFDRSRPRDGASRPRLDRRAGRPHPEGAHLAQEQGTPVPLRSIGAGHPPNADLPRPAAHQPCVHPGPAPGGELRRVPPRRGLRRLPHRLGNTRRRGSGTRRDDARDSLPAARREGDPRRTRATTR